MSTEQSVLLDQLEAEFFREARRELEPDQAHIDGLWLRLGAAGALGAAVSSVSASLAVGSWTPPEPFAGPASVAPAPSLPAAPPEALSPTSTVPAPAPVVAQTSGVASFGVRALLGAAAGGALLGFIAGYGSAGLGEGRTVQRVSAPPAAVTAFEQEPNGTSDAAAQSGSARAAVDLNSLPTNDARAPASAPSTKAPASPVEAQPAPSEPAEPAKPSFYEELQYLKRAQSALRQGNGALALGLMTTLDSIQPGGALLSERGVAKVLAHCQLGDVEAAQRVAAGLAAEGLASVYSERLEHSCAGEVFLKQ